MGRLGPGLQALILIVTNTDCFFKYFSVINLILQTSSEVDARLVHGKASGFFYLVSVKTRPPHLIRFCQTGSCLDFPAAL